jgi:hypothetical protein
VIHFFDELVSQLVHLTEAIGIVGYIEHEAQH